MEFPNDLPHILFYRVGSTTRPTLCRRPVHTVGTSGKTDAAIVCPMVPLGADAWRLVNETEWRPLSSLPPHWLPFLYRARPSPLDLRPLVVLPDLPGAMTEID